MSKDFEPGDKVVVYPDNYLKGKYLGMIGEVRVCAEMRRREQRTNCVVHFIVNGEIEVLNISQFELRAVPNSIRFIKDE